MKKYVLVAIIAFCTFFVAKAEFAIVTLEKEGNNRLLVNVKVPRMPFRPKKFLIDTGATGTVINETTLSELKRAGNVKYLGEIIAYSIENRMVVVSQYLVSSIMVGECLVDDVQVVVLPGLEGQVLGLSTLKKIAPFVFSTTPPLLLVTNCRSV